MEDLLLAKKKDLYRVLGVNRKADSTKIKKAYRTAAKKYHPDISPKSEEKFKEVQHAYETLSDPNKKAVYDLEIKKKSVPHSSSGKYSQPFRPAPLRPGPLYFFDEIDRFFSDMEDLWVRRPGFLGDRGKESTDLLSVEITLTPSEASNGCEVPLEVPFWIACRRCSGSGFKKNFICGFCRGRGRVRSKRKVRIIIPSGLRNGIQVKIPIRSRESTGGVDLFATIRVSQ